MTTAITEAAEMYLESYRDRVGIKGGMGRQAVTYNTIAYDLKRAIIPIQDLDICTLGRPDVEKMCKYWMRTDLAPRTIWKMISSFKGLLDWADSDVPCYTQPKGLTKLWAECRPSKKRLAPISEFDADALGKLLAGANDQVRLYALLGLNAGMYQTDISDLTPENVRGDTIAWSRSKTEHQSDLVMYHRLWPQTKVLIEKLTRKNGFDRLLVTSHGTPLVTRTVGQRDADSISQAWHRACKSAGVEISFRDLRKWGASAIARLADLDTQRMYRGEVIKGSSKDYVLQAFEAKLTPALVKWHQELQTLLSCID